MISENCKYSYYDRKSGLTANYIIAEIDKIMETIQQRKILGITGYKDGIVFIAKQGYKSPIYKISGDSVGYFLFWNPDMIEKIYGINYGCTDIVNSHLGQKAMNAEQARIYFIAKVLGQHD